MSEPSGYTREVRDTVVKSTLTGVAATAIAIVTFSPAGLGGMIGTSVASGVDANAGTTDDLPLAPFPALFSANELESIHSQLARSAASLEIVRAATDDRIEHIRAIALTSGAVTFTPMPAVPQIGTGLRSTTSNEVAFGPAPIEVSAAAVSHINADVGPVQYVDPNLELAELLLAR